MAEEENGLEPLSRHDLDTVKAGLPPYEAPVILDLTTVLALRKCDTGISCVDGNFGECSFGVVCRPGNME